jgi:hypothetical protein
MLALVDYACVTIRVVGTTGKNVFLGNKVWLVIEKQAMNMSKL